MNIQERYRQVLAYFESKNPAADTELHYETPFQLLVAVILSAQCTDKRVNIVTPALFRDFATPEKLSAANFDTLFPYIRSVTYPNSKTKHLISMAHMLVHELNSQIPDTVEGLMKLPGVGRKTANVIASVVYNQAAMAVDTHVFRVSKRIGLTHGAKTPLAAEKQLMRYIPEEKVPRAHHWLILHGRYVCTARSPKCTECELQQYCKYFERKSKQL